MSLNGIGQLRPARMQSAAKCEYCGLYGALGNCDGCGAPNEPCGETNEPIADVEWVETTTFSAIKRTFVPCVPANRVVRG